MDTTSRADGLVGRRNRARRGKLAFVGTLVALAHFAASILIIVALGSVMSKYMDLGTGPGPLDKVLVVTRDVLWMPVFAPVYWLRIPLPPGGDWVLLAANSSLWGFGAAMAVRIISGRRRASR